MGLSNPSSFLSLYFLPFSLVNLKHFSLFAKTFVIEDEKIIAPD